MNDRLYVLRDAPLDGPTNMARDEQLLDSPRLRPAALRLYAWNPPTISLGCFQRYAELERLDPQLRRLDVVRRPTGGGAILHDREITYALALDDTLPLARLSPLDAYRFVHACWRDALARAGVRAELAPDDAPPPAPRGGPFFCFARPARGDLLLAGLKLAGSAQRRVAGRILQHGSLLLGRRFPAHPGAHLDDPPPDAVARLTQGFVESLAAALSLTPAPAALDPDELRDVDRLRLRYADPAWTRRR